jgi:hypothetical protein
MERHFNAAPRSMIMVNLKCAALALGLAASVAASPAFAKQRIHHPGYAARAQAVDGDSGAIRMSGGREAAIRECSDKSAAFRDYTWGMTQSDSYRVCMAGHGQPE